MLWLLLPLLLFMSSCALIDGSVSEAEKEKEAIENTGGRIGESGEEGCLFISHRIKRTANGIRYRREASAAAEKATGSNGVALEEESEEQGVKQLRAPEEYEALDFVEEAEVAAHGVSAFFFMTEPDTALLRRMEGGSLASAPDALRGELVYLRMLYRDFGGVSRIGEMICHRSIAEDLLFIFEQLYLADYPIGEMRLVDDYGGDDNLSAANNNTSCFNYRPVSGGRSLSCHAYGLAVDVNPLYNPYVIYREGRVVYIAPKEGQKYIDRSGNFPHKINSDDLCFHLFTERGFRWGGFWENRPDYMHFTKWTLPEKP